MLSDRGEKGREGEIRERVGDRRRGKGRDGVNRRERETERKKKNICTMRAKPSVQIGNDKIMI